jgi:hypothetical protein
MPLKQKNVRRPSRAKKDEPDNVQAAANSYCIRRFALGFSGGTPRRLCLKGVDLWIVPVLYNSPGYGVVGEVGMLAIDVRSGEVVGTTPRDEVKSAAARLAQENRDAIAAAFLKARKS